MARRLIFTDELALKKWLHQTVAGRRILEAALETACLNCTRLRDSQSEVEAAKAKTLIVLGNDWCQVYSEGRVKIIQGDLSPEHGLIEESRIRRSLPWTYRDVFDWCRGKGRDTRELRREDVEWLDYLLAAIRELAEIRRGQI